MQAQGLLRRLAPVLNWGALAALLGALAGLSAALKLASDNSYFQESMRNLAGRELEIGAFRGAQSGLLIAAGALLVFFLAWPVCRLILRSSRKATLGAALAVPVLAILAIVAFKINLDVFPSLLSVPSLLGNAGLLAASFLLWWFLVKWLAHLQDRLGGIAGSLSATAALGVLLVLVVGAPMGLAQLWKVEVDSRKPNVLIVLIDALRADRLGSYGYQSGYQPEHRQSCESGLEIQDRRFLGLLRSRVALRPAAREAADEHLISSLGRVPRWTVAGPGSSPSRSRVTASASRMKAHISRARPRESKSMIRRTRRSDLGRQRQGPRLARGQAGTPAFRRYARRSAGRLVRHMYHGIPAAHKQIELGRTGSIC